ncbi:MAG: TIM44-like domain-containing protein [Beijerinckiaceae bacterium]
MTRNFGRVAIAIFAGLITLGLSAEFVDAKPGRGAGSGSRGARTEQSVPSTPTAPRTSPSAPSNASAIPGRPPVAQAAAPSRMSTMAKGFAAGLIGAGLFGLLSGSGLFGGLSGIMGFLGLFLQIALLALVARLIWGFFRNRQASAMPQAAGPAVAPDRMARMMGQTAAAGSASAPNVSAYQPQPVAPQRSDTVGIGPDDYNAFQGVLANLMSAYSSEDIAGIRRVATPEMAAGFIKELHENQSRGVVNRLGDAQLLQGDLAEAWYEDSAAYATVAVRYAMTDVTVERASGKVIAGNPNQPEETVEIWTFLRDGAGRPWVLCAQQQA